tara:strand:+ start:199 stop:879 length:681 start_codon:yes stop_codon:yes gene_type:complete
MSYGLLVKNDSGFTQIDATFDNVAVFASGTINSSFVGGTLTKVAIPANTPNDYLIFCKPNSESGTQLLTLATWLDGSGFSFFTQSGDTTVISVNWVIAVRSRNMPTNNNPDFGLEVYKQNQEQAFSSNNLNFRCLQVSFDNITSNGQTGATFTAGSLANVFSLMSGKTLLGRLPLNFRTYRLMSLFVQFNYTSKTIKSIGAPVAVTQGGGSSIGGGYKTNLIGIFR